MRDAARKAFKNSPTGERLFFWGSFFSKPFIVPDAETEEKLIKKIYLFFRISFYTAPFFVFVTIFPLALFRDDLFLGVTYLSQFANLVFLGSMPSILMHYVIRHLLFRHELASLKRAESHMILARLSHVSLFYLMLTLLVMVLVVIFLGVLGGFAFYEGEKSTSLFFIVLLLSGVPHFIGYIYAICLKIRK